MTTWLAKTALAFSLWLNPTIYHNSTLKAENWAWFIGCLDSAGELKNYSEQPKALKVKPIVDKMVSSLIWHFCEEKPWNDEVPGTLKTQRWHVIIRGRK